MLHPCQCHPPTPHQNVRALDPHWVFGKETKLKGTAEPEEEGAVWLEESISNSVLWCFGDLHFGPQHVNTGSKSSTIAPEVLGKHYKVNIKTLTYFPTVLLSPMSHASISVSVSDKWQILSTSEHVEHNTTIQNELPVSSLSLALIPSREIAPTLLHPDCIRLTKDKRQMEPLQGKLDHRQLDNILSLIRLR